MWNSYLVSLGKVTNHIRNGSSISQNQFNNGIPISRIETISFEEIDLKKVGYSDSEITESDYFLKKGDILFSHINSEAHIGKSAIYLGIPEKIIHGINLLCIRPNNNTIIPIYLLYLLKFLKKQNKFIQISKRAVNQASISTSDLKKIQIPLPPISEQYIIVNILEQVDELRKKKKQVIEKSGKILTLLFYKMFGDPLKNEKMWKKLKLSEISTINPPKKNIDENTEVSFIPMSSIDEGLGKIKKYDVKKFKDVKVGFTYFEEKDVLFAKITPCMENGKAAIALNLKNKVGFGSTEFHVLRANEQTTPEFLFSLVRLPIFRNIAKTNFTGTVGQQRVPTNFMENFEVIVPDIHLQIAFSKYITIINDILIKNEESKLSIDSFFDNILYRAFTGELTSKWREKNKKDLNVEIAERILKYGF